MAGVNRPAIIIAGIAGLCVSVATGVGLGSYTASGMNPLYGRAGIVSAYADAEAPLIVDGAGEHVRSNDQFSETVARSLTGGGFGDRPNDPS
ncbi:hypothetical protein U1839_02870 [Sphingomonas sp. RT2P30]|uniref:hypothetical protein n=1 Tax=Parasphingomonas halimpatiens TaxID=3096162 RepID=UPI002FC90977